MTSLPRTIASSLSTNTLRPSLLRHTAAPLSRPAAIVSQRRGYHEKVLDHYSNPRNVGSMNKNDTDVGTGKSPGAPKITFLPHTNTQHQASSAPPPAAT